MMNHTNTNGPLARIGGGQVLWMALQTGTKPRIDAGGGPDRHPCLGACALAFQTRPIAAAIGKIWRSAA